MNHPVPKPRIVWSGIDPIPRQAVFDAVDLVDDALRLAKLVIPSKRQVMLVHAVRILAVASHEAGLGAIVALVVPEE